MKLSLSLPALSSCISLIPWHQLLLSILAFKDWKGLAESLTVGWAPPDILAQGEIVSLEQEN
jgi:hypothetical protein